MRRAVRLILGLALLAGIVLLGRHFLFARSPEVDRLRLPEGGLQPQVLVDDAGVLHVVYFRGDPVAGDIVYTRSLDFETLSDPIRINSEPGSAVAIGTIRGAQIALGREGRIHVAWNGSTMDPTTGAPMLYSRFDPTTQRFEPQRNLMTRTVALDGGGSIAADRDGNVYVAWHGRAPSEPEDEGHRRVWIAASADDGTSFAAEEPIGADPTGACACCGMGLHATAAGALFGLFRVARDAVHRDMALVSGASLDALRVEPLDPWELSSCPMTSVALHSDDAVVLGAWETRGRVHLARLDGSGQRAIVPMPCPSDTCKHPRIAVHADGRALMAWTEGTAWAKGGDVVWQPLDSSLRPEGAATRVADLPPWTFAAVAARPDGGFVVVF